MAGYETKLCELLSGCNDTYELLIVPSKLKLANDLLLAQHVSQRPVWSGSLHLHQYISTVTHCKCVVGPAVQLMLFAALYESIHMCNLAQVT